MKVLALCLNIQELQDRPFDPEVCKKFPGSGYLPHLVRMAKERGYAVMGGKEAIGKVDHGLASIHDVIIMQEDANVDGRELFDRGAKPQLVFCLESKMYVPWFYDWLGAYKKQFKHQLLFDGGTEQVFFPTFEAGDEKKDRVPWSKRKPLCMISSNKQVWSVPVTYWNSPSFLSAYRNELHSARLRAIEEHDDLDLYGHGWDNLDNLPAHWAHLKEKIRRQWKGVCQDKIATLEQYQYAVCYENTAQPGYVTEKQVDCLIAGTRPLYKGPLAFSSERCDPIMSEKQMMRHTNQAFAETCMRLLEDQ